MKPTHLIIAGMFVMLAAAWCKSYTHINSTLLLAASIGGFVCFVIGAAQPPRSRKTNEREIGRELNEYYEKRERKEQDEIDKARDEGNY